MQADNAVEVEAEALAAAGNTPRATSLLADALADRVGKPSMHLFLAKLYLETEQFESAVCQFTELIALFNPKPHSQS